MLRDLCASGTQRMFLELIVVRMSFCRPDYIETSPTFFLKRDYRQCRR